MAYVYGAGRLNRTVDLPLTRRLLYHLSYAGKKGFQEMAGSSHGVTRSNCGQSKEL